MSTMDNERVTKFPKNAFDSEYQTEWLREVRFLTEKGIRYTFVRKTRDYGISQYKYTKTPALFAALIEFYSMVEAERMLRRPKKIETVKEKEEVKEEIKEEVIITPEEIKKAQELLELAAKQNKKTEDDTI